jgi:crotonobetainyl-CoA:carnitine CoA-transferase CaiB-like acyl-CoA transferase
VNGGSAAAADGQGPLSGLRVIELAQGVSGPFCAMQLADLGADVVKIEPPDGDRSRRLIPPGLDESGALFWWLNRNKRGIALDLANGADIDVVRRLTAAADVFIEDLGPGRSEELDIGYATLADANPRLVYGAISPFGEKGLLRDRAGSELVVQAIADYTGSLGWLGGPPVRVGTDVAQMNAAIFLFQAVMAALVWRATSQRGQRVSVSMLGALLNLRGLMWAAMSNPDDWFGFHLENYVKPPEYGYRTKDLEINFSLGSGNTEDWDRLLVELDMLDVLTDERFENCGREAVGVGRYAHQVRDRWEQATQNYSSEEIIEIMHRNGGNAVVVNNYSSLTSHPQVEALNLITEVPCPEQTVKAVAVPWEFSETPAVTNHRRPPRIGEHSEEILLELGYTREQAAERRPAAVSG